MISLKGSRTLTVVHPEDPSAITADALRSAAFLSASKSEAGESTVSGFVSGLDPLDEDPSLGGMGSFLVFAWREDKKSVPGAAVKLAVAEAMKKEKAKTGGLVSKARRDEIKEQIKLMLLSKAPWTSSTVDLIFNQDTGDLYVFEAGGKKFDAILQRLSEACGTEFETGGTVQSLAELYMELLDGSRDAGEWTICENGGCTLAKDVGDKDENGKLSAVNAPEAVKAALEDGFAPVSLNLRIDSNESGEPICTFSPALEPEGRGWTMKGLKVNVASGDEENEEDEMEAACTAFASIVEIASSIFRDGE